MAGLDKEETVSLIAAGRDVFMRFGSTRLLALGMQLAFFYGMAKLDGFNAWAYGLCALGLAGAGLWSLHTKPHLDRVNK
jgi:hypothetical protein